MPRIIPFILIAPVLACHLLARTGESHWHSNLDRALAEARESGRPVLLVFR